MSAPTASTPASSHVPQLVELRQGRDSKPGASRTISAVSTQTSTATALATRRPVGNCPWCAPPQGAWPRGAPPRVRSGRQRSPRSPQRRQQQGRPRQAGIWSGCSSFAPLPRRVAPRVDVVERGGGLVRSGDASQAPANILECGALASLWVFNPRARWKPMRANMPTAAMSVAPASTAVAAASPIMPSATVVLLMRVP